MNHAAMKKQVDAITRRDATEPFRDTRELNGGGGAGSGTRPQAAGRGGNHPPAYASAEIPPSAPNNSPS